MILAGRGFGKTKAGSEWVRSIVCGDTPLASGQCKRIALVAETAADARDVLVQGDSGLLAVHPPEFRPTYIGSTRSVKWPNGATALIFNAVEPDQLRGPQFDAAWCLTAETPVAMADGTERPIASVKVGDLVKTRNGAKRVISSERTRRDAEIYRLTCSDGRKLDGTCDHPVHVVGEGWVKIGSLTFGDELCAIDATGVAQTLHIVSVDRLSERADVFDIAVEDASEFFANGILVHNCDELAKWRYAQETWDMLQFGLRLGDRPRQMVTTTPRPIPTLRQIMTDPDTVITRGSTYANAANLAPSFLAAVKKRYEGTRLGRQELKAEVLDDVPGALWTWAMIDAARPKAPLPTMLRIVVAVDPSGAGSSEEGGDWIGIVAAGRGVDGRAYILADRSCKLSPAGWGRRAVDLYNELGADRIIGELNFGGAMVGHVIRTASNSAAYEEVKASRGKVLRAEPIAALYEQFRVTHAEPFEHLEAQMTSFTTTGYTGEGSPDRVDAMVWALTALGFTDYSSLGTWASLAG